MMKLVNLVVVVLPLAFCWQEAGANPVVECEHAKLNTEDATPVDPGGVEISFSYGLTQSRRAFGGTWGRRPRGYLREEGYEIGVKYGLAEDLDIGFGLGYASVYDRDGDRLTGHGWTDLAIGAKWRFYHDEEGRLEIAYTPAVSFPTGENEATDDFFNIFNGIAVSKDWTDRLTSNFDLGYNQAVGGHRDEFQGTLSLNAALGYHITQCFQPEIELNYAHDFNHGSDGDLLAVTCGCILCIHENVRVDLGVQQALTGRHADMGTSFLAAVTVTY